MSASQRARAAVPPAQRSVIPTIRGVSAGVAVLVAVGFTLVGMIIDGARGTELTKLFGMCYFLGCLAAVVAVRQKAIFTTMVQPPLILFVAVPLTYQFLTKGGGTSIKDILLDVALPLVNRFPWMLVTTLTAVVIGGARLFLARRETSAAPSRSRRPRAAAGKSLSPKAAADRTEKAAPSKPAPRGSSAPTTQLGSRPSKGSGPRPVPQPAQRSRRTPPPRIARAEPPMGDPRPQHTARTAPAAPAPSMRSRSDVPAHPAPQVRYRRREQPPFER